MPHDRVILGLGIIIVAVDAVESLIARSAGIPYAWFMIVQILVYTAIGFVLRRRDFALREVLIAAAATALIDGIVGERVAVALGGAPATPLLVAAVVVPLVVIVESALALTGFALGSVGRTARS
ncbi:MAG TPA: hypothetical protein VGC72_07400 [Candidatus Elarobacter sp.]